MKTTSAFRIKSNGKLVKQEGRQFASDFVNILGEEAVKQAQANVAPGRGPGPHPHRPGSRHIDTGNLMRSISYEVVEAGQITRSDVSTDVDYGLYLEMGWTTKAGTHYRYPWLYPAVSQVSQAWASIGRSSTDRWFGSSPATRITSPLSGTW